MAQVTLIEFLNYTIVGRGVKSEDLPKIGAGSRPAPIKL
jgi:hypothetical protein